MNKQHFIIGFLVACLLMTVLFGFKVFESNSCGGATLHCVSSPIDEMVTKIKKAESGIITSTGIICMYTGERYTTTSLLNKVTNLNSLEFKCDGAAVCKNGNRLIVTSDKIDASADLNFKGLIACVETSGDYDCTITIKSI